MEWENKMENIKNRSKIRVWILSVIAVVIILIICCLVIAKNVQLTSNKNSKENLEISSSEINKENTEETGDFKDTEDTVDIELNPIAEMDIQGYGKVKIKLYPKIAPETVSNFIALSQNGFYNGLKFHRIVDGFMIQGGDPKGNGTGLPKLSDLGITDEEDREYCIKGEFLLNGHKNNLKHEKGVISMARTDYTSVVSSLTTESYNSAGSQFFIMTADASPLDGAYTSFGKVIEGIEIIEQIEKVEVYQEDEQSEKSIPVEDVIISKVTIETYGRDYALPKTLETFDFYKWLYQMYGIKEE